MAGSDTGKSGSTTVALERIEEAVKTSAQKEADLVVRAAQRSADERVEAEREAAKRDAERQYQSASRMIEEEFARKLLQIKGANGKDLLEKRNVLLLRVFDLAQKQILAMDTKEYVKIMAGLLERAAGDRGGKLRIHPKDKAAFETILNAFNGSRSGERKVAIDESQPLPEPGGFILVSDTFEVDQTAGTLLSDMEHELAPQIAADLFAE
jgi:vacuolar-type H+-ATPase subunit E/Vma4